MNCKQLPIILFVALCFVFLAGVLFSIPYFPPQVATHFNSTGEPDAWTNRSSLLPAVLGFGVSFSLFVPVICWLLRFVPGGLNIPNRDHWLSVERRAATFHYLFTHAWWFACLALCFAFGMHLLLLHANYATPPNLSTGAVVALAGAFLIGVVLWVLALVRRFNRVA